MKKYFLICCLLFVTSACHHANDKQQTFFYQGTDSYGRTVTIEKESQRIVSLSASISEIIFLLHCEDKLAGISDFCDYPPETKDIPKVGKLLNLNIESILSVNPDLIFIGSIISKNDVEKLEQTGIPIFFLKKEDSIDDLYSSIQILGTIFQKTALADSLVQHYRKEIEQFRNAGQQTLPTVYYVAGFGQTGDFTAPGNSFIHDIITLAGGENIGKDLTQWSISREHIFEKNPDYIFIRKEDLDIFCHTYPYTLLDAVKNGRVYPIESGWIDIVTPRNIEAIKYIREIIHRP